MEPALRDTERTDEALMARAREDDAKAFGQLYDRHAERAFRIARAICGDGPRAENAVQEGFLAIWRGRASHRPDKETFQTWAVRSVRERAIANSEREQLSASLRRLPEAQAEVILLAFYGELTHSEIAKRLDLPAATVKGRMRLGLEKLRGEMDGPPREPGPPPPSGPDAPGRPT